MDTRVQLLIINGIDKSDSVASYQFINGKCNVVYKNSQRVYRYNSGGIHLLKLQRRIDPQRVIFRAKGNIITKIDWILDFGEFYRIVRVGQKDLSFHENEVVIENNCLANKKNKELFDYFKETARDVSMVVDNEINILNYQYQMIAAVSETTILAKYMSKEQHPEKRELPPILIYPFGLNQSQKTAVENAFSSQVSIIQGPPGTGKTQTILNIIANAVRNKKTVAVVSNNNAATQNVSEKLEKYGVSFLTASLGSLVNKNVFLQSQIGKYPDMSSWCLEESEKEKEYAVVKRLTEELNDMFNARNRIAKIEQELLAIKPEMFYFYEYYDLQHRVPFDAFAFSKLSSQKLMNLWLEYERNVKKEKEINWLKKIIILLRFNKAALHLFNHVPKDAIPFIQRLYYERKNIELINEKELLERKLFNYQFDAKMQELSQKSMYLFKAELAQCFQWEAARRQFQQSDFRAKSDDFNREYPVVLSTTYSIKGTLSANHIYDYLIIDEASQVDIATGVLAFSCARNVVIVGDQKQLPNVLTSQDIRIADAVWDKYTLDEIYHFSTHSLLSSAAAVWQNVPSVLLKEHYRCHPKIAGFFNQKFYDGKLLIMTLDHNEKDVLSIYRTAKGNHARNHKNQRQIDVIKEEVLPKLVRNGYRNIGIITPYREQVTALKKQLSDQYEIATVHKFQGREKDAIVLSSVDDNIGEFVDDPNLFNVAVSRAVKSLSVVISQNEQNAETNFGNLAKYIEYNNFEIIDSHVFSVFDMLYKSYTEQRIKYLKKHKKVSEYDSENLMYTIIEEVLQNNDFSQISCVVHTSLSTLIKNYALLSEEEAKYASNSLTHIDFLLFNKMDKAPLMAIEVDGTSYHAPGSRQAERDALKNSVLNKCKVPLIRVRTDESNERERIITKLREII